MEKTPVQMRMLAESASRDHVENTPQNVKKGPKPAAADEAGLFSDHWKDEVRVVLWEKIQLSLSALKDSLAKKPPAAHCDHGLDNIVTVPSGILIGIEEDEEPHLLIRL